MHFGHCFRPGPVCRMMRKRNGKPEVEDLAASPRDEERIDCYSETPSVARSNDGQAKHLHKAVPRPCCREAESRRWCRVTTALRSQTAGETASGCRSGKGEPGPDFGPASIGRVEVVPPCFYYWPAGWAGRHTLSAAAGSGARAAGSGRDFDADSGLCPDAEGRFAPDAPDAELCCFRFHGRPVEIRFVRS